MSYAVPQVNEVKTLFYALLLLVGKLGWLYFNVTFTLYIENCDAAEYSMPLSSSALV